LADPEKERYVLPNTTPRGFRPTNPFIIGHPAEGEHFADRVDEVETIVRTMLDPSSRLVVYGERRLGKSSAVARAATLAREAGHDVAIIDLAKVTSAEAAAQKVLSAVHTEIGRRWTDTALDLIKRLRAGSISLTGGVDANGQPTVSFAVNPALSGPNGQIFTEVLDAVEAELASRKLTMGIALDEFQRLRLWCGEEIDWPLKSMFERHRHIAYVLAGSERALITQMLANKKAGLWKVVDILDMQPIPNAILAQWLVKRADDTGVRFERLAAASVVLLAGPRTRDVVQLARVLWDATTQVGTATSADAVAALDQLVDEQASLHLRTWKTYEGKVHQRLLALFAANPSLKITSAAVVQQHHLGPKTTITRAVGSLVADEILVETASGAYVCDDPFFQRWLELNVFEDFGFPIPNRTLSSRDHAVAAMLTAMG